MRLCLQYHQEPFECVSDVFLSSFKVRGDVSYGVRDHGGEEWPGGIVGVELAHK